MSLFTKVFSARKISRGFTLVELIIVVVIIGILASVGVPRYSKVMKKAKIAEADSVLGAIRGAEIRWYAEAGSYTATLTNLDIAIPTSIYFNYTFVVATELATAAGKGSMQGVGVTLKIDGTRTVTGL